MSDGHRTSTIARPRHATRPVAQPAPLTRDLTKPIAADKQLVTGRAKRGIIILAAVGILVALVVSLFVLPVRAWMHQHDDIARKQAELAVLDQANGQLAGEVSRLNTPDGIKQAAREELGWIERGEIRLTVASNPTAPLTLPSGWPYDAVSQIIAVRLHPPASASTTP